MTTYGVTLPTVPLMHIRDVCSNKGILMRWQGSKPFIAGLLGMIHNGEEVALLTHDEDVGRYVIVAMATMSRANGHELKVRHVDCEAIFPELQMTPSFVEEHYFPQSIKKPQEQPMCFFRATSISWVSSGEELVAKERLVDQSCNIVKYDLSDFRRAYSLYPAGLPPSLAAKVVVRSSPSAIAGEGNEAAGSTLKRAASPNSEGEPRRQRFGRGELIVAAEDSPGVHILGPRGVRLHIDFAQMRGL